jgi:RNA polymerase sigma factor (sigma-70 family)
VSRLDRRAPAQEWWGQLFVDHRAGVLATCRAILRHHEEAEDATQEVFARVPADPAVITDARRWLLEVARNVCIDMLRYQSRRPALALDGHADHPAPQSVQQAVVERMFTDWVLGQLPPRESAVLSRQLLLDQPLEVVAENMGISYAVAGKLASRARRRTAAIAAAADRAERNEPGRNTSSSLVVHGIRRGVAGTCGISRRPSCAVA